MLGPLTAGLIFALVDRHRLRRSRTRSTRCCSRSRCWATCGCRRSRRRDDGATGRRPGLRGIVDGLRFLATQPVLLLSFAVDIIAMVLAMPRALFPEVAEERFGGGAAVGWLFAAIAIGVGARRADLGLDRPGPPAGRWRWSSRWSAGGWRSALSGLAHHAVADGAAARRRPARPTWSARCYRQSILQSYAPDEMRGRLQGVFIVVVAGGPRLGDLRAGATAAGRRRDRRPGSAAGSPARSLVVLVAAAGPGVPALRRRRPARTTA